MKALWIDEDNDPQYSTLAKHGIDAPFFSPRDPRVTASYLDNVRAHPGIVACGLYWAWNWDPLLDGPSFVEKCDSDLRRIGWQRNALVCLDIETHDMAGYVLPALKRWRELRPKRPTWWTLEGMQGPLLTPELVHFLVAGAIGVAPSMYAGDMSPLPHDVTQDLLLAGVPGERIVGMYDAAALPYSWRGFAFTQGRLPQ